MGWRCAFVPNTVALTGDEHAAAVRALAALLPAALSALAVDVPSQRGSEDQSA